MVKVAVPITHAVDFLSMYAQDALYAKYYTNELTERVEKFLVEVNTVVGAEVKEIP